MEFFNSAIEVLQTLVVALGAGLGVWGAINLLEGYGNDRVLHLIGDKTAHGWRRRGVGRHYPHSSAERPVRLRTAGGGCRPVHIIIRSTIVTILSIEGEADARDFTVSR